MSKCEERIMNLQVHWVHFLDASLGKRKSVWIRDLNSYICILNLDLCSWTRGTLMLSVTFLLLKLLNKNVTCEFYVRTVAVPSKFKDHDEDNILSSVVHIIQVVVIPPFPPEYLSVSCRVRHHPTIAVSLRESEGLRQRFLANRWL